MIRDFRSNGLALLLSDLVCDASEALSGTARDKHFIKVMVIPLSLIPIVPVVPYTPASSVLTNVGTDPREPGPS